MILEAVLNLVSGVLKTLIGWINLPQLPAAAENVIDTTFEYLEAGIGFVSLVVDMNLVKILLPLVVVLVNFDEVWSMIMFVLRKIPFLGIK